jgi:hypothetical protein
MSLKTKTIPSETEQRRLHNTIGTATGATRSLELIVEEFQSILSFWATGLSGREK